MLVIQAEDWNTYIALTHLFSARFLNDLPTRCQSPELSQNSWSAAAAVTMTWTVNNVVHVHFITCTLSSTSYLIPLQFVAMSWPVRCTVKCSLHCFSPYTLLVCTILWYALCVICNVFCCLHPGNAQINFLLFYVPSMKMWHWSLNHDSGDHGADLRLLCALHNEDEWTVNGWAAVH